MIDDNVHLIKIDSEEYISPDYIRKQIRNQYANMKKEELYQKITKLSDELSLADIEKAVLYIFDEEWYHHDWFPYKFPENIIPAILLDPELDEIEQKIKQLAENNIRFAKLLPYEQHIFYEDYEKILKIAQILSDNGIVLTVCCAYGSRYLYQTNGVELTSYLLNGGIKTPIIMAHGGMPRVFDAMSLMFEFPNLYMDISFALNYWKSSRIWDDYRFVFEKLDYKRIFYGSDFPYVSFEETREVFDEFCEFYKINDRQKKQIEEENFRLFLKESEIKL